MIADRERDLRIACNRAFMDLWLYVEAHLRPGATHTKGDLARVAELRAAHVAALDEYRAEVARRGAA